MLSHVNIKPATRNPPEPLRSTPPGSGRPLTGQPFSTPTPFAQDITFECPRQAMEIHVARSTFQTNLERVDEMTLKRM